MVWGIFKLDKGYEAIENGFSECFNSVLVSVRSKPLLTMLEAIRVIVLETMNTMRKISATYTDDICPSILMRIDLMKNHTRFWHVIHTGGDSFEEGQQKKRIRASHEGGSETRVSKVGGQATCQNCFQVGHNKKGGKAPPVQKLRSSMGRNATCLGRSASGVNGINFGLPVNVNMGYDNVFMGSTNVFVGSVSGVGGSVQGTGGSGIGRVIVRGYDIPGFKWSPPQKRAFNRVGGCSFSTRPRHQNVRRGFVRWFGNDDSRGVSYDMNNDTQGNQVNQTSSQAIPSDQGSQTEVEIPTQEMPSQATNDVPPEVQRVRQQRPIVP
ncbi:hypothetical protein Tco_0881055, partial [Tanacetum coccineum]